MTAGTIYHELVQEFGDFFLLVGPGGLTVPQACAVNFVSGVSVMIGAMWYLWLEPGMGTQGILLAFSAGVYTYVACTEAAGEMLHEVGRLSPAKRMGLVACFALGAIGIGLILLDHEHCGVKVADGEADPHELGPEAGVLPPPTFDLDPATRAEDRRAATRGSLADEMGRRQRR